ncbi:MAG: ribose/xylose/arabinose/galactoside ABC-type transport system permease subunit, partial [Pirellulaceae bacterium]
MKKVLGIFGLLVFVCLLTTILNPDFAKPYNIQNTLRWTSLFGIISIGVAFVIITGGIDLSIGSLVGLIGCILPMCLLEIQKQPPGTALNWTFIATGISLVAAGIMWGLPKLPGKHARDMRWPGFFIAIAAASLGMRWLMADEISAWSNSFFLGTAVATGVAGLLTFLPKLLKKGASQLRAPAGLIAAGLLLFPIGWYMPVREIPEWLSICLIVVWTFEVAIIIGLLHGFLITQVKLQPFVVTLCGLLFYRGFARWLTDDQTQGFGTDFQSLKTIATGRPFETVWVILTLGFAVLCWGVWQMLRANSSAKTMRIGFVVVVIGIVTFGVVEILYTGFATATFWTITIIGPLAIALGIWTRSGSESRIEPQVSPIAIAAIGYALAIAAICGLSNPEPSFVLSWQSDISPTATQIIMLMSGELLTAVAFAILLVISLREKRYIVLAPLAVACLGGAAFWLQIQATYAETPPAIVSAIGFTAIVGSKIGKIFLTVVNLSLVVGSIIVFLRIATQLAGVFVRSTAFLFITGAILVLAGMTPIDQVEVPSPFLLLMALAVVAGVFLNFTIYGRYLLALGRNEEAARYSGINTDSMIVMAYVICSCLACMAAILFALDINSIQPSGHGNFYELYAIA